MYTHGSCSTDFFTVCVCLDHIAAASLYGPLSLAEVADAGEESGSIPSAYQIRW